MNQVETWTALLSFAHGDGIEMEPSTAPRENITNIHPTNELPQQDINEIIVKEINENDAKKEFNVPTVEVIQSQQQHEESKSSKVSKLNESISFPETQTQPMGFDEI